MKGDDKYLAFIFYTFYFLGAITSKEEELRVRILNPWGVIFILFTFIYFLLRGVFGAVKAIFIIIRNRTVLW